VAIRVDICCAAAEPATAEEVSQDPCLVPYPVSYSKIPKSCQDKWPEWCDYVDCAESPPESRLVHRLPDGRCAYKDECLTDVDCTLAVDVRRCCTCPEPYPRELIDVDPCVVLPEQAESPSPGCPDRCTDFVLCDGCPPPGAGPVPHCTLGDALNRCAASY
jgi:hypothetical protein